MAELERHHTWMETVLIETPFYEGGETRTYPWLGIPIFITFADSYTNGPQIEGTVNRCIISFGGVFYNEREYYESLTPEEQIIYKEKSTLCKLYIVPDQTIGLHTTLSSESCYLLPIDAYKGIYSIDMYTSIYTTLDGPYSGKLHGYDTYLRNENIYLNLFSQDQIKPGIHLKFTRNPIYSESDETSNSYFQFDIELYEPTQESLDLAKQCCNDGFDGNHILGNYEIFHT